MRQDKNKNRCWPERKTRDSCWFFSTLEIEHVIFVGENEIPLVSLFLIAYETTGIVRSSVL